MFSSSVVTKAPSVHGPCIRDRSRAAYGATRQSQLDTEKVMNNGILHVDHVAGQYISVAIRVGYRPHYVMARSALGSGGVLVSVALGGTFRLPRRRSYGMSGPLHGRVGGCNRSSVGRV